MRPEFSTETDLSIRLAYRQFLNTQHGAHAYNAFKRILYGSEDSLVQTLNNNLLQKLPVVLRDGAAVCDIGGGDGERIKRILGFLHEKFCTQFRLDFVEQSSCCMAAFASDEIDTFTRTRRFESLFEDADLPGGYDLALLIHSIFAFEGVEAVDRVLSLPRENGTIVVVSNAADSFLAGLKSLLDDSYSDRRFEINDLRACLDDRGISYQVTPFETRWALKKEALDHDLATILEWLSLGSFSSLSSQKLQQIRRYVHEHTTDLGNRLLFTENEIAVVVPWRKTL
ncbi:MAG: hypothetical protein ACLQOO_06290 [Terriglobia bacterium]